MASIDEAKDASANAADDGESASAASASSSSSATVGISSWASKLGRKASQLTEVAREKVTAEAKNVVSDVKDFKDGVMEGAKLAAADTKAVFENRPQGGLLGLFKPPSRGEKENQRAPSPEASQAPASSSSSSQSSSAAAVEGEPASQTSENGPAASSSGGPGLGFGSAIRDLQAMNQEIRSGAKELFKGSRPAAEKAAEKVKGAAEATKVVSGQFWKKTTDSLLQGFRPQGTAGSSSSGDASGANVENLQAAGVVDEQHGEAKQPQELQQQQTNLEEQSQQPQQPTPPLGSEQVQPVQQPHQETQQASQQQPQQQQQLEPQQHQPQVTDAQEPQHMTSPANGRSNGHDINANGASNGNAPSSPVAAPTVAAEGVAGTPAAAATPSPVTPSTAVPLSPSVANGGGSSSSSSTHAANASPSGQDQALELSPDGSSATGSPGGVDLMDLLDKQENESKADGLDADDDVDWLVDLTVDPKPTTKGDTDPFASPKATTLQASSPAQPAKAEKVVDTSFDDLWDSIMDEDDK
eukprot:TRINITY_DN9993_c3_g1_i1.p1 TRINITY_DN9993_c3_g1~~TRINITY_DN9993_c3_g1_i1.p1  ORF type:complete len:548 (-),score=166.76 TRINITY_DN9993_c3_g1_i1:135-1715(-)